MVLRPYRSDDCPALAKLFYETVHTVCKPNYSPEQLDAWASGQVDLEAWDRSFLTHTTLVAEADGRIVGFGDMDESGYLDRLYVHVCFQRRGVGSALVGALEAAVPRQRYTVHASRTALPFFLSRGYRIVQRREVTRRGVVLENFAMEKTA